MMTQSQWKGWDAGGVSVAILHSFTGLRLCIWYTLFISILTRQKQNRTFIFHLNKHDIDNFKKEWFVYKNNNFTGEQIKNKNKNKY